MNTLTNKATGDVVAATMKGHEKGKALITARSSDGVVTSCTATVKEARKHMARLHEQGWR